MSLIETENTFSNVIKLIIYVRVDDLSTDSFSNDELNQPRVGHVLNWTLKRQGRVQQFLNSIQFLLFPTTLLKDNVI